MYMLAFAFGGIEQESLGKLAVVVVSMTLLFSALGIILSLVSADVRTALSRSFFMLILLGAVTAFPGFALVGSLKLTAPNIVTYWLGTFSLLINPMFSAIDVLGNTPFSQQLQWQGQLPVVVPMLLKDNLLWLWSAITQVTIAAIVLAVTTFIYPRYRASKTGDVV
jgi:hypothetical protein